MGYGVDKFRIDTHRHTHKDEQIDRQTDTGHDNAWRPKLALGSNATMTKIEETTDVNWYFDFWCTASARVSRLTHCRLVMPYGRSRIDLSELKYRLFQWLPNVPLDQSIMHSEQNVHVAFWNPATGISFQQTDAQSSSAEWRTVHSPHMAGSGDVYKSSAFCIGCNALWAHITCGNFYIFQRSVSVSCTVLTAGNCLPLGQCKGTVK